MEGVRRRLQNESRRAHAASGLCQQPRSAGRALLQSHVPGLRGRPGDVRRFDPGRIFAAKPLAKLPIRIRHARLCVSPRNLAPYRSTDGEAGLGYDMVFERAANARTAAPTEMMPRLAAISGMALTGSPAEDTTVEERDRFEIRALALDGHIEESLRCPHSEQGGHALRRLQGDAHAWPCRIRSLLCHGACGCAQDGAAKPTRRAGERR